LGRAALAADSRAGSGGEKNYCRLYTLLCVSRANRVQSIVCVYVVDIIWVKDYINLRICIISCG